MLDETFAESIVHKPAPRRARLKGYSGHVILGRRLRPFSFWHAANLDFIKSPYAANPGKIEFVDLLLAAKCCQLKYPDTITTRGGLLIEKLDDKLAALRFGFAFQKFWKFRMQQHAKFSAYLSDYFTCGPVHAEGEGAKPLKLPWYLYYVAILVKRMGVDRATAWNWPVADAQWWITALAAAEGAEVDILTPKDREDLAQIGVEF